MKTVAVSLILILIAPVVVIIQPAGLRRRLRKKGELRAWRDAKRGGGEFQASLWESCTPFGDVKDSFNLLREDSLTAHPRTEVRVV